MRQKMIFALSFSLIFSMLALVAQGAGTSDVQLNSNSESLAQADYEKTMLSKTVDGIQINLTYYADLAVVGFPVSFMTISKNVSADLTMIHMDPDVTIKTGNDPVAFWHGHTHTGDFSFEYAFPDAGMYTIEVDFLTSGDTVNFMGEEFAFGKRTTSFDVIITDGEVPTTVIGPGVLSLLGIQAEFDPSKANPDVGDYIDLHFNITYDDGSLLRHLTTQLVLLDPDGQLLLSSRQVHEHTGQFLVKNTFTKAGLHRIVLFIEPTMPPMRTQTDIGFQVAAFGLQVGSTANDSDTNDSPGFELAVVMIGLLAAGGLFVAKKRLWN
ncbi:MAG: hypothetical protein ACXACI_08235 [Candidatus Hodarchaeales archaeon]|jgi:hypothetical protein